MIIIIKYSDLYKYTHNRDFIIFSSYIATVITSFDTNVQVSCQMWSRIVNLVISKSKFINNNNIINKHFNYICDQYHHNQWSNNNNNNIRTYAIQLMDRWQSLNSIDQMVVIHSGRYHHRSFQLDQDQIVGSVITVDAAGVGICSHRLIDRSSTSTTATTKPATNQKQLLQKQQQHQTFHRLLALPLLSSMVVFGAKKLALNCVTLTTKKRKRICTTFSTSHFSISSFPFLFSVCLYCRLLHSDHKTKVSINLILSSIRNFTLLLLFQSICRQFCNSTSSLSSYPPITTMEQSNNLSDNSLFDLSDNNSVTNLTKSNYYPIMSSRSVNVDCSYLKSPAEKKVYRIIVEGNIGSGKTTFLKIFSKNCSSLQKKPMIEYEPVDLWRKVGGVNIFQLMADDPKRWSFTFQSYVQLTMVKVSLN